MRNKLKWLQLHSVLVNWCGARVLVASDVVSDVVSGEWIDVTEWTGQELRDWMGY